MVKWAQIYGCHELFLKSTDRNVNNLYYLTLRFLMKLTKVACLIQDVSPYCGDKRMARRCTRRSLPNYFDMTSYHWNVRLIGFYIRSLESPGDLPRVIEILCLFASGAQRNSEKKQNFYHEWRITRAFPTTHVSTYFFRKPTTFNIANS
jgi:hypothetical protein